MSVSHACATTVLSKNQVFAKFLFSVYYTSKQISFPSVQLVLTSILDVKVDRRSNLQAGGRLSSSNIGCINEGEPGSSECNDGNSGT